MAEAAREAYGGYSGFTFVDNVSDAQNCPICLCPMRDTVQTACGHRFCRSCLLQTFRQSNNRLCPQDRIPIPSNDKLFLDSAWQRDINSLRVKCQRWKKGCDWIGAVGRHKEHFRVCKYKAVICNDCGTKMQERHLNTHQTTNCPCRTVQCEHCGEDIIAHFKVEHFNRVCKYKQVTCNDCGSKMQERHLNTHQTTTCPFRTVQCEYCGEDIIAYFKMMHECEQCRNFRDKQEIPQREDECIKKEKERCIRYQEDFQKKKNLMNTKTAKAVVSLHTAANYLDESWKMYNQTRFAVWWGKCVACTGGIAAFATGHPVIGVLCTTAVLTTGMTGDVFTLSLGHFLSGKWSPELCEAEKHFIEAECAVEEVKDTIQFWKKIPTLAKKLHKIHEDMLQKAENVPITPKQAGLNTVRRATTALLGQNVHYSIRDIVKNWGCDAAKILRQKAKELNELTELQ